VHEAGLVIMAGAGPPVVGEIAGGYRLAGDMQLAPGHPARYPASYATPPAEHREDGAGFLLPFGRRPRFLGILSRLRIPPLLRSAYRAASRRRGPKRGFHVPHA
jgi:hypothetical protein